MEVWRGKLKGGRAGRFMVDLVTFCVLSEITLTFLTRKEPLAFLNPITDLILKVTGMKEGEEVMGGRAGRELMSIKEMCMWEEGTWKEVREKQKWGKDVR